MSEPLFAGIEIGGTKLQMVVGDQRGRIVEKLKFKVNKESGAEGIRNTIKNNLPEMLKGKNIHRIGVGFGGPVDWKSGKICKSHQIEGWSGFDIAGWLRELASIESVVENDANTAAYGEAICGAGRGLNPVFYITLGSGVGGGLVVDGKIYHGKEPGECEIGHVRLNKSGITVESQCSGWAVDRKIRDAINSNQQTKLRELVGNRYGNEACFLPDAISSNDPVAIKILHETCEDLAFALSHVVHLFHPQVIVIGGGLSNLGELLRGKVAELLPGFVMEAFHPVPQIKIAELGEDAVPVGAILLAAGGGIN